MLLLRVSLVVLTFLELSLAASVSGTEVPKRFHLYVQLTNLVNGGRNQVQPFFLNKGGHVAPITTTAYVYSLTENGELKIVHTGGRGVELGQTVGFLSETEAAFVRGHESIGNTEDGNVHSEFPRAFRGWAEKFAAAIRTKFSVEMDPDSGKLKLVWSNAGLPSDPAVFCLYAYDLARAILLVRTSDLFDSDECFNHELLLQEVKT